MKKLFLLAVAVLATIGSGCASPQPAYHRVEVVAGAPRLRVVVVGSVRTRRDYGKLHVNVNPERARVFIDGVYQGRGDVTRVLRAGRHSVRVELRNGASAHETVYVEDGQLTRVRLDLD